MHIELSKQEYINNLDKIVGEIEKGHLSVFVGAGVSTASGYVDWNGLMKPIVEQLGVNPNIDLSLVAQFYDNRYYRHNISKLIYEEFNKPAKENGVLKLLGSLPISSYWTTNYDSLIEDTLSAPPISKTVEVMLKKEDFKFHKNNCEATVYKMHGDKNSPDEAIITKNDYETYDAKREVFTKALSVELIANTFLFIGFSFSDPNLERILNVVKHTFDEKHQKIHYCFMRKVQEEDYTEQKEYIQDVNYQSLRIEEMRRCGIETILLDDFSQIDLCLSYIKSMLNHKRIFISGSLQLHQKDPKEITKDSKQAKFIQHLAEHLTNKGYKLISGFGQNIGNYLLIGSCANKKISQIRNIHNLIEIYPIVLQVDDAGLLREELISNCGNLITIFGKSKPNQEQTEAMLQEDGVYIEYKYARQHKLTVLPIGCTGNTSKILWEKENLGSPYIGSPVESDWSILNSVNYFQNEKEILDSILRLLEYNYVELQNEFRKRLRKELLGEQKPQKVFLSFHYNTANQHAKRIRGYVNETERYLATEEEQVHKDASPEAIMNWIVQKLDGTVATILIYDDIVLESQFVKFELEQSVKRGNTIIILSISDDLDKTKNAIQNSKLVDCRICEFYKFSEVLSSADILKILTATIKK